MTDAELQIARLSSNAASMLDAARSSLAREFASIDRAHDIRNSNKSTRKPTLSAPTLHDLAANNPLLRKMLLDLQKLAK
jgi:hypothetical protein